MRINKFLSLSGLGSRRGVEKLIIDGCVTLNSAKASLTDRVEEGDVVEVDGKTVCSEEFVYYVFNKPIGVISSNMKESRDKIVLDFFARKDLSICGRLDKQSRGLMVLTNDGDLAYRLTHPKFDHEKEYIVDVKSKSNFPSRDFAMALKLFKCGHTIDDKKTRPAYAIVISQNGKNAKFRIILKQGIKRQIRRTFEKAMIEVVDLERIRIGAVRLEDLAAGEFKKISSKFFIKRTEDS